MSKESVAYSLGGLALIDFIDKNYGFFSDIFGNIPGPKEFMNRVKPYEAPFQVSCLDGVV